MTSKNHLAAGAAVLALFVVITQWLLWRLQGQNAQLSQDLSYLQSELAWLRKAEMLNTIGDGAEDHAAGSRLLQRALQRLGDKKRSAPAHQTTQTIKRFGQQAVPELLELIATGDDQQRQTALMLLLDMRPATAAPLLRHYVAAQLERSDADSDHQQWKIAELASAVAVLVRLPDPQALPLFEQNLEHAIAEVRAADMTGVARLGALRSVALGAARQLAQRVDTAVRGSVNDLAQNLPAGELRQLAEQLLTELGNR